MITIWKFPFSITDRFSVTAPEGAVALHVDLQGDQPCLWAKVHESRPVAQIKFRIIGTGHPWPLDARYVGTFQQYAEGFVWHLFQEESQPRKEQ